MLYPLSYMPSAISFEIRDPISRRNRNSDKYSCYWGVMPRAMNCRVLDRRFSSLNPATGEPNQTRMRGNGSGL